MWITSREQIKVKLIEMHHTSLHHIVESSDNSIFTHFVGKKGFFDCSVVYTQSCVQPSLQHICIQSLTSKPEKTNANNIASPPKHTSEPSSLSGSVLSVHPEIRRPHQCINSSISVNNTSVQFCNHGRQDSGDKNGIVFHGVGVRRLDTAKLFQLLGGEFAL